MMMFIVMIVMAATMMMILFHTMAGRRAQKRPSASSPTRTSRQSGGCRRCPCSLLTRDAGDRVPVASQLAVVPLAQHLQLPERKMPRGEMCSKLRSTAGRIPSPW